MVNRRAFIGTIVAAVGAWLANPSLLLAKRRRRRRRRGLGADTFRNQLNQFFELQGDLWHYVELVKVHEYPLTSGLEQFSLVFRGSMNDTVLGTIHPSGTEDHHNYYISHFSLIQPRFRRFLRRQQRRRQRMLRRARRRSRKR